MSRPRNSTLYPLCGYPAAALTIFKRPLLTTTGYIVECQCGWESKRTKDWRRSLDAHIDRSFKKRAKP